MSANDGDLVDRMAKKHSVSPAAVQVVLAALRRGGGRMAQFSHADFGGMSQWSPGMSMVGEMFNTQLKAKLEKHITECPNCWVIYDTMRKTVQIYKGMDPYPIPADVEARLMQAIEKKMAAERK